MYLCRLTDENIYMKIFNNEDIRAIDRATIENEGVSSLQLIDRVADGVAAEIMRRWRPTKPTAIFAGPGNNGADALAVAYILIENGWQPEIYLFNIGGNRLSQDCLHYKQALESMHPAPMLTEVTKSFNMPDINSNWLVIDGLFGSGLHDPLPGGFQSVVRNINDSGAKVVSIDVPSGLFADWNANNPARNIVHATLTIAIQFLRLAFLLSDNAKTVGEWQMLDINLSEDAIRRTPTKFFLVERHEVRHLLKPRGEFTSKADYGSMLLVGGSFGMMGAAVFAAKGALRSGVGKLTIHTARCGYNILQMSVPEALFNADKHDIVVSEVKAFQKYSALAVGPGLGVNELTANALDTLIKSMEHPAVFDADALNCMARRQSLLNHLPPLSILTPHEREFDRIFGPQASAEARLLKAIEVSHHYNVIIVLKGRYTAVVRPDGRVYFNSSGTPAMATGGSGDVLTGVIGSLRAQGYKPEVAAVCGVFIHGWAGELAAEVQGEYGVIAGDIADNIGKAIAQIME